jgi:hypothetical protein
MDSFLAVRVGIQTFCSEREREKRGAFVALFKTRTVVTRVGIENFLLAKIEIQYRSDNLGGWVSTGGQVHCVCYCGSCGQFKSSEDHYPTSWKFAGSIPDGVIGIFH